MNWQIFNTAFERVGTTEKAVSGLSGAKIYTLNPHKFNEDFTPTADLSQQPACIIHNAKQMLCFINLSS